jgi:sugar/nucleoside kinase (ribokinase family)
MSEVRRKYDVYGMGNALVDLVCRVDDAFLSEMGIEKGRMILIDQAAHDALVPRLTPETRENAGSVANSMIALSFFGGKGFYSCKVADDKDGRFYLDQLREEGLATNSTKETLEPGITGKAVVMVTPDAERTFNTFLGATETFSTAQLDSDALAQSEWLYIEGYLVAQKTAQPAAVEAVRTARANGVKVALTFSDVFMIQHFRQGMDEIVGDGVDLILCNEDEARSYTGKHDLAAATDALKKVAKTFAITRGPKGTIVYDGKTLSEVTGVQVKAIDTVGAGDMFAGAFLYGITHGFSYEDAAKFANMAASSVVTKFGPRLGKDELQGILKTFKSSS